MKVPPSIELMLIVCTYSVPPLKYARLFIRLVIPYKYEISLHRSESLIHNEFLHISKSPTECQSKIDLCSSIK